MFCISADFRGR